MSVARFIRSVSLWSFSAMVSKDLFDSFTAKGINLHQCKRKIRGVLQNKIYSVSQVQIKFVIARAKR